MLNRPLVKWVLSTGERYELKACIWELAGIKIIEVIYATDIACGRYR